MAGLRGGRARLPGAIAGRWPCLDARAGLETLFCGGDGALVLREPLLARDKHFVHELPYFRRIADRSDKRIEKEGLSKKRVIAAHGGQHAEALNADGDGAAGGAAWWQLSELRGVEPMPVHIARSLDYGVGGKVGGWCGCWAG